MLSMKRIAAAMILILLLAGCDGNNELTGSGNGAPIIPLGPDDSHLVVDSSQIETIYKAGNATVILQKYAMENNESELPDITFKAENDINIPSYIAVEEEGIPGNDDYIEEIIVSDVTIANGSIYEFRTESSGNQKTETLHIDADVSWTVDKGALSERSFSASVAYLRNEYFTGDDLAGSKYVEFSIDGLGFEPMFFRISWSDSI